MTDTPKDDMLEVATRDSLRHYLELEAILDCVSTGIIVVNAGNIFLMNREAEYILGYSRSELKGKSIETVVPESKRGKHKTDRSGYEKEPRDRPMAANLDIEAQRKDGEMIQLKIDLRSYISPDTGLMTVGNLFRKIRSG